MKIMGRALPARSIIFLITPAVYAYSEVLSLDE
jgi:hypothetical protein